MDRAVSFYEAVLTLKLLRKVIDGYEMAFFPRHDAHPGASGALAKGDIYNPSLDGAVIYFDVPKIDVVLDLAIERGSRILYAKKDLGEAGYVAELEDSEGNRLAFTQTTS